MRARAAKVLMIMGCAVGTAGAEPAAQPSAELSAADATKLLAFYDGLLGAMAAQPDCAKMATTADGMVTKNAPFLRTITKQMKAGKTLPKDTETKLTAAMTKHMDALKKCATDRAVNAAMARLGDPDLPPAASAADLAQVSAPVATDLETYTKNIRGKGALIATFKTSAGTVRCQLLADKAPMTVANFVGLATGQKPWLDPKTNKVQKRKPFYDGTTFHRVIPEFMIQGGDRLGTGTGGPGYQFADEVAADVKMAPGVLAMANSGPSTNGSQFFITESAPSYLDGKHTIFGTCAPLDVVKKIARVKRDDNDRPSTAMKMTVTISRGTL